MLYVFGDCELDTARQELRRAGLSVPLEPKAYQVLLYLVEQRDRLVTREDILAHVWPGVFIDDSAVSRCVIALRKAMGDSAGGRIIRTRRGYGYQFVAAVDPGSATASLPAASSSKPNIARSCCWRYRPKYWSCMRPVGWRTAGRQGARKAVALSG
jgi:DNA-binding winged helix-turn-helix (wHTH) protein